MPQSSRPSSQAGFSLVELIVAMAVTIVVTGAVYGLIAGGNNAFRREPELTERQQNVRVAMDLIQKDIANAGVNMGPFFQSFTPGLNAARPPHRARGQVADHLEIFGNTDLPARATAGRHGASNGVNFANAAGTSPLLQRGRAGPRASYSNGGAKWGLGHNIHADATKINFPPGQAAAAPRSTASPISGRTSASEPAAARPNGALAAATSCATRSRPTSCDGVPASIGARPAARNPGRRVGRLPSAVLAPRTSPIRPDWQTIARGIEDLQVQYRNGRDSARRGRRTGSTTSPRAAPARSDRRWLQQGIRQVRVTHLRPRRRPEPRGRATGATAGAGSRANAVRGAVTSVTTRQGPSGVPGRRWRRRAACPTCPVWR